MTTKPHGIYRGIEYITGNGQYRMGSGSLVTGWHATIEAAHAEFTRVLEEAPMPWCDHCQSYHHETARCINKGAGASPGWPDAFSIKVF